MEHAQMEHEIQAFGSAAKRFHSSVLQQMPSVVPFRLRTVKTVSVHDFS